MASQQVFLMIDADRISPNVERAIRVNNPTKIARMGQDIERGNKILRSWLEDRSGKVLLFHGDEVYCSLPGEHLADLGTVHAQMMEAWNDSITIGVGIDLDEAQKALKAGKKRGGSRIVFYAPEIESMVSDEESASDSHAAKEASPDPEELKELSKADGLQKSNTPSADMGIHAIKHRSLQMDRGAPSPSEPSPYAPAQASAHGETPVPPSATNMAAQAGGPSVLESQFHSAAAGTEAEAARAEAQANAAQPNDPNTDKIKQTIVKILQKVKQQAPILEQLKEQAPDAYQAVVASVQAMLMMAKQLMPQSAEQQAQGVAKMEETFAVVEEALNKSASEIRRLHSIALNDDATPEQVAEAGKLILANLPDLDPRVLKDFVNNPKSSPELLEGIMKDPHVSHDVSNTILGSNKIPPEKLFEIFDAQKEQKDHYGEDQSIRKYVKQSMFNRMTPELQEKYYDKFADQNSRSGMLRRYRSSLHPSVVARAASLPSLVNYVVHSPHFPKEKLLAKIKAITPKMVAINKKLATLFRDADGSWPDAKWNLSDELHVLGEKAENYLESAHLSADDADALRQKLLPDTFETKARNVDKSHALKGSAMLEVKPGTNKIRKIRDFIESKGGELSPADLGKQAVQVLNGVGRLPNGNFSAKLIHDQIAAKPGVKVWVNTRNWHGGQQHTEEPSNVLQVALPTHVTEQMRAQGFSPQSGHSGGHPGDPTSGLGWVRWTGNKDGVHIDEIQHDYDLGHQKSIEKILGHPIQRVIHEAFHEWVRQGGAKSAAIPVSGERKTVVRGGMPVTLPVYGPPPPRTDHPTIGTPVHIWTPQTKAPNSGWDPKMPLPAHAQLTYGQEPEKRGMEPGTYGEIPTQSSKGNKGDATFKDVFRKSVAGIRAIALAKSYQVTNSLRPMSTGIDNQVKAQGRSYSSNNTTKSDKVEGDFDQPIANESRLTKIRKATSMRKDMPMPEATNKVHPTPSGAQVARLRGDATPQAHKYHHIEPGQAAHISMDGRVEGKSVIRQAQSGQTLPNAQQGEAMSGVIHPTSALDPTDGREQQGNQKG